MKIKHLNLFFSVLFFLSTFNRIEAQIIPHFKTGDKVVFIGNSITQGGTYHMLFQAFFTTRYPDQKVEFYNCGIAGDVADGMIARLDKDILYHKPNYAFLMVGMNDIRHLLYGINVKANAAILEERQNALNNYFVNTEKLVSLLSQHGVKPIFITPSIYDQTAKIDQANNFGANDALGECANHIRKLAKAFNAPLIDFYQVMISINQKKQSVDSTFTIVGPDRIHPGDVGHFVMAHLLIDKILPTNQVSKIEIDAQKKTIKRSINCEIKLDTKKPFLAFNVLQKTLPFPIKEKFNPALDLVPFQDQLNQETLIIRHLPKGSYTLTIDGRAIANFSAKALSEGINLADHRSTPQYQQALTVFYLCEAYHQVQGKLRSVGFVEYRMLNKYKGPKTLEGKRAYLNAELEKQKGKSWYDWNVKTCNKYFEFLPQSKKLKAQMKGIRKKIFVQNQPVWHEYRLEKL